MQSASLVLICPPLKGGVGSGYCRPGSYRAGLGGMLDQSRWGAEQALLALSAMELAINRK